MKLKHWQGYGTVNAVKVEKTKDSIVVKVEGDHEYGLVRDDVYDAKKWLLERFMPSTKEIPYYQFELFVYRENCERVFYTFRPRFGRSWKEVGA